MKKVVLFTVLIIVVILIGIFVIYCVNKNDNKYKVDPEVIKIVNAEKEFEIEEVLPANYMDHYGTISTDEKGNEWRYTTPIDYIVLTSDGTLCSYTKGSYIIGVEYSEYKIKKTETLNTDEKNKLIESINNIDEVIEYDFYSFQNEYGYMLKQNNISRYVNHKMLNEILSEYGFEI